jgi:hypothetical protein
MSWVIEEASSASEPTSWVIGEMSPACEATSPEAGERRFGSEELSVMEREEPVRKFV